MIYVYGDSFAYGSDLKSGEKNVSQCLSEKLNIEVINRAIPGNSNIVMSHQLMEDIVLSKVIPGDTAFICFTETTRFSAWDEQLASGESTQISKYTPIFPSNHSPQKHHELFKWSCTSEQGIYDLAHSMITMCNACECNGIQVIFGYAFGKTISEYKGETGGTKLHDMITYIENKNMQIADKRFCEFDKEYKYGNHPNANAHKEYAHYISSYLEGTI
tara:strand:- start:2746 stop:3396 length:651 start_codon:yes stop_codon:yes gene_type:complete